MLQITQIEDDFEKSLDGLNKRGIEDARNLLEQLLIKNNERKIIQKELDEILRSLNEISKEIGELFKQGKGDEANKKKEQSSDLKNKSKLSGDQLNKIEEALKGMLLNLPNIPNETVPAGKSEDDNEVIKLVDSNIPSLAETKRPHWDLIEEYDIIDFELGNKVTGAGFPFYKGSGARLVRAMVNYFLDQALKAGYYEIQPPVVVNEDSGYGTGQLPDKEGQMYVMEANGLYLIPTAEVPITNIYRNEILNEDQLPVKCVGYTPCFRREAGSWGAHVRGLNRLHQFDKVEIVQIVKPQDSYKVLEDMVAHVEMLVQSLDLPYRILKLCAGDLGFTSAITYDFEVFSAAQEKWLEVSSVSNFEAYQANRLKLRIKDKVGNKTLAHTLNGSALAIPRILAAILENNQTENGIKIPKVLQPYCGFNSITK